MYLQRVKAQLRQVAEAGVSRAEVVDREAYADASEKLNRFGGPADANQHRRLGQFNFQQIRIEPGPLQRFEYLVHKRVASELDTGDVDCYLNGVTSERLPADGLGAGPLHDVGAERDNLTALFSHRDELGGRNRPKRRVVPPGESLEADQPARSNVELRLVVNRNLFVLQRTSKLVLKCHAFFDRIAKILGEECDLVLAASLGGVHRIVGLLQQIDLVVCEAGESGNANAGADCDLLPLNVERQRERLEQVFRDRPRFVLLFETFQYGGKLVPAHTRP